MARAVTEFQSLLAGLARDMETRIQRLVSTLTAELDQFDLLAFLTDAAPELVTPFINAAADLTTLWYEDQDPGSDFQASPADLISDEELAASARWAMSQDDPAAAWTGAATRSLFETARQTVIVNAQTEGVRWARHASATACGFCRLLAVRGAAYKTEAAALAVRHTDAQGHDHCHCIAVPVRGGAYDPPPYIKQWKADYESARQAGAKTAGQIANAMDYLPGGRRYKGDDAPPHQIRPRTVNRDVPQPKPAPSRPVLEQPGETDAQVAKRLLPGLEKSLADLRARGVPENSPQIQYHLTQIARLRRQLAAR